MTGRAPDLDMLRARLVGLAIGGEPVTVRPHEGVIGHRALGWSADDDPNLHPVWATLLGLRGMDLSFERLFELAEGSAEDGIYFGEAGVELRRVLEVGSTYRVSGQITDLVRRRGRKAGTFDVLTFELYLRTQEGEVAATASNSFVFVRRDAA